MRKIIFLCFIGLSLLAAVNASADLITYDLFAANTAITPYPGPYAELTVNRTDSTHATITFDALNQGNYEYLFGAQGAVAVNVNGTATFGSITGSNSFSGFAGVGPLSNGGSGNEDGFGKFSNTIDSFGGFTHTATQIVFDLIAGANTTWAAASDVLIKNADDYLAAAHIFVWDGSYDGAKPTGALATGYAAVPEPATMLLLGFGLVGLTLFGRKRFLKGA